MNLSVLLIGGALTYPTMVNLSSTTDVLGTVFQGTSFEMSYYTTVFGIPVIMPSSGYTSSVIPIILAVLFAAKLDRSLRKALPDVLKNIVAPFVTLVVTVILTYLVIGPVATLISNSLAWLVSALYSIPYVGGAIAGEKVTYSGEATIQLTSTETIDDSKIDSSDAVISLVDGDGYYTDELILKATTLDNDWSNGQTTYTLSEGDIEWSLGDYVVSDSNSGKEWSAFGGDGNGVYTFNLQVSGLKYDGEEVDAQMFKVKVYIYGRDATDMAEQYNDLEDIVATESSSGKTLSNTIQWTWKGSGDKPNLADNIYITWSKEDGEMDLSADAVTITLTSEYGDSLTLSDDDYQVFNHDNETQIALIYRNWASNSCLYRNDHFRKNRR
ncbi:PTS transporter subunit EIIC [Streptococcus gallolyticus]|uniref:Phosphotransferase system, EIIC n=1 Tax=Streptococcus gallolyticus TaxID=315405 RepID=A0A1H9SEC6_9STRE|nr:PTS transporter subunit EIIC [Streptococcus gallolyticus]SER83396.1 Phosphotransferase system, EIIC [Streptococcus gallolyticus]